MASEEVERRLAAILSADAVGYSRLMAQDEGGTIRTITAHRKAMESCIERERGRVVDAPGDNVLAVEIHQENAGSSDISFDAELRTSPPPSPLIRGPYLQMGTPNSIIVRWRTGLPQDSRLAYGPAPGNLSTILTDPTPKTEHEVVVGHPYRNGRRMSPPPSPAVLRTAAERYARGAKDEVCADLLTRAKLLCESAAPRSTDRREIRLLPIGRRRIACVGRL